MLENLLDIFSEEFKDKLVAWDRFIEFLATDSRGSLIFQLDHKFEWLYQNNAFINRVLSAYDHKLLKSDYYDHLGELYLKRKASPKKDNSFPTSIFPTQVAETMADVIIPDTDERRRILIPDAATGRLIMATHKRAPKALTFGVESNLRLYRIAFTNLCIHGIYGKLLHADPEKHEVDIATRDGKHNWEFANSWSSHWNELKPIPVSLPVR